MPAKNDDKKDLALVITPVKVEKVGPSTGIEKQSGKMPMEYWSPFVVYLMKLRNKLSEDKLLISDYVFSKSE